jgi:hypothetical protein
MTPNTERDVNDFQPALQENVRRVVAISALRRMHRLIATWEEEKRILRRRVLPIAAVLMLVLAALIWLFFNPYLWAANAPDYSVPMCAPEGSVTI